jgi:hypothetical protein
MYTGSVTTCEEIACDGWARRGPHPERMRITVSMPWVAKVSNSVAHCSLPQLWPGMSQVTSSRNVPVMRSGVAGAALVGAVMAVSFRGGWGGGLFQAADGGAFNEVALADEEQ